MGREKGGMHRKETGIKQGEIFNEEKRKNEGLLVLKTLFNPRLEPES